MERFPAPQEVSLLTISEIVKVVVPVFKSWFAGMVNTAVPFTATMVTIPEAVFAPVKE